MTSEQIRESIENAIGYLGEHPEESRYPDSSATAVMEGFQARVKGPGGAIVVSDNFNIRGTP